MSSDTNPYFVPYEEPTTKQLLSLIGFLLSLPLASYVAGRLIRAPLLGPLCMGIVFGKPVTGLLDESTQVAFARLGYLGLLLMVLHAGLASDLPTAKRNLWLSLVVAATGIILPIGLSMLLLAVALNFSPVQAFTSGAALSSTSLGTTFSLLRSANLSTTKVGTVLATAALADDVVGLVLLRIVDSLAADPGGNVSGWQVARPVVVSLALMIVAWGLTRWLIVPVSIKLLRAVLARHTHPCNLLFGAVAVVGTVGAAAYAGTSVLLGAFVAGLVLAATDTATVEAVDDGDVAADTGGGRPNIGASYTLYVEPVEDYLLSPLFFASIGFSIPLKRLFNGSTVWRGILYSLLMTLGKVLCGVWALKVGFPRLRSRHRGAKDPTQAKAQPEPTRLNDGAGQDRPAMEPSADVNPHQDQIERPESDSGSAVGSSAGQAVTSSPAPKGPRRSATEGQPAATDEHAVDRPSYLFASLVIGFAMTARGEIGLLISQVAFTASADSSSPILPEPLFLIATWAIMLCTVAGPLALGLLLRRMKKTGRTLPTEWR